MEFDKFQDGYIIAYNVQDDGNAVCEDYGIYSIDVKVQKSEFGVYCDEIIIKSGAPSVVNRQAQEGLLEDLDDVELAEPDEDGDGDVREQEIESNVRRYIVEITGVDGDDITITIIK